MLLARSVCVDLSLRGTRHYRKVLLRTCVVSGQLWSALYCERFQCTTKAHTMIIPYGNNITLTSDGEYT